MKLIVAALALCLSVLSAHAEPLMPKPLFGYWCSHEDYKKDKPVNFVRLCGRDVADKIEVTQYGFATNVDLLELYEFCAVKSITQTGNSYDMKFDCEGHNSHHEQNQKWTLSNDKLVVTGF